MKRALLSFVTIIILSPAMLNAQGFTGIKSIPSNDSIEAAPYKWTFPLLGKRVAKKGFNLPLAAGIMLNPYIGSQEMLITDLQVGFNDRELVPLDFVKFGKVNASIQSVTIRPDLWILPFVDIYGIAGVTWTHTSVELIEPIEFNTTANFFGTTFGLGTTFALGFHNVVTILDVNHTWSSIEEIKGSIQATMFTPRLGYNFKFKKPQRNITVWVGAPGIFINRVTEGTIDMSSLNSDASGRPALQNIVDEADAWYQDLSLAQKKVVKTIAQKLIDKIDGIESPDLSVSYSLVKKPVSNWSMSLGCQFQVDERWQFRTEAGFFGGRKSLLLSGNFRFGL